MNDKNFPHKGIQASVSDSRAVGYLLRVRSIIFLFLQLSVEVDCGAAQEMRSGHLGQDRDTCPDVPRPLMQFTLCRHLVTSTATSLARGVKPLQCHCHWAVSSWPRVVSLPSVKVLVGDPASCACLPEGARICVDVGTIAITPAQLSYS